MVDTFTNPPSQKGVIDKINEIITAITGVFVDLTSAQNITGTKTFVGQKKIAFKQSSSSDKLGFTLYNNNNVEKGYLEFNPSNLVDSAPLMTLGNYTSTAAGVTHVGFRKYDSNSGGAYNLLAPLVSDAKTPFSLSTTYTNFYLPLGVTNGNTTVTTAKTGVLDISSLLPTVNDATLTITQGGVSKGTFTANAASNVVIDLDAGGGSSINLVGKLPITVQETQSGGATNIDTSGGYIKNTYNNLQQSSSTTSSMAVISNSGIGTSPSTVKELFTGNVSYFDVPTNFGERATAASGTLVTETLRLGGYSSLNSNYYPVVMWGVLASDGEFTPVIYQRAYGSGTMMNGYVSSVANNSSNSIKLNMLVAETSTTNTSSSTSAGYNFTVSLLANGNMNARWDRYNGTTDYYINRELNSTSGASILPDFKRINCIRVFLYGNSTNSYLPTVNDTTLTQDSVVTSWKVTDSSVAGTTIGINIDSTPTSASNNAITSGGVYTALGNYVDLTSSQYITGNKTIYNTSLTFDGTASIQCSSINSLHTITDFDLRGAGSMYQYPREIRSNSTGISISKYGNTSRTDIIIDGNTIYDATVNKVPYDRLPLPSQTGNAGKVLTTDGTDASWGATATVYPVIETYINGTSWYRIYAPDSTGYRWCEMGDLYYKGSTLQNTDNTINFLKNFKDLNFGFTPTPLHSTANLNQYQMYEKYPDRTVSSVNLHVTAAVFGYSWTACGYIANEV